MPLSEKREKELMKAATNVREEINFLDKEDVTREVNTDLYNFLVYLSSENLVKHSRALTIWTIVIAISTILLFLSAVITLIERLCNS